MEEEVGVLEPYELQFSDLILLTSDKSSSLSCSHEEIDRLESISRCVMENLGPAGPGLITIAGVPHASRLRRSLLPLARRLSLLNPEDRKRILKGHSLGSDVPLKNLDRIVSSFAMQLKYVQGTKSASGGESREGEECNGREQHSAVEESGQLGKNEFKNLGNSVKELGFCMMELGLCLARICDCALGGQELGQSLLESCTAKGRLIHYHSNLDNLILKEASKRQLLPKQKASQPLNRNGQPHTNGIEATPCGNDSKLWQQWHYDYGIFTVLTSPMFIVPCHKHGTATNGCFCSSCERESPSPTAHTLLKIFYPSKNQFQMVKANPESFIIQVGEAADILSKGKLRANLHSVSRPIETQDLSRETFVVFLQPAWNKTFSCSDYPIKNFQSNVQYFTQCTKGNYIKEQGSGKLGEELHKIVPPLFSRLKDGMTFAEFSQETTRQYYGGSGLQSKR